MCIAAQPRHPNRLPKVVCFFPLSLECCRASVLRRRGAVQGVKLPLQRESRILSRETTRRRPSAPQEAGEPPALVLPGGPLLEQYHAYSSVPLPWRYSPYRSTACLVDPVSAEIGAGIPPVVGSENKAASFSAYEPLGAAVRRPLERPGCVGPSLHGPEMAGDVPAWCVRWAPQGRMGVQSSHSAFHLST